MRTKGKIASWNDKKGFGFITPDAGGKQVFIHIKAFSNRNRRPEINQLVTYALSANNQGRPCAVKSSKVTPQVQETIFPRSFLGNGIAKLRYICLAIHANRRSHNSVFD
jgi:cold shock CspA family protein